MAGARGAPSGLKGNVEISKRRGGVFIGGDPEGLRSLAKLLIWLADADQESHPTMPDGEREHVHLYPNSVHELSSERLTPFSVTTELCRLDAKGTGYFPDSYYDNKELHARWKRHVRRTCSKKVNIERARKASAAKGRR